MNMSCYNDGDSINFCILIVASRSSFDFLEIHCHDSKMLHVFII